jgi:putative ABC transport system substrate-binding protein
VRRRDFIGLLGGVAAISRPLSARAQQRDRAYVVGVIMIYAEGDPEGQERLSALREQLHRLGWVEDGKIRIEVRWAAGKADLMRAHATEFVSLPADIMVVSSTPVLAIVKALTPKIPIVFTQVADPVGSGLVSNYVKPGGNITGFTDSEGTLAGKWLEVLKEAAPFVNRLLVLRDPNNSVHQTFLTVIDTSAVSLRLEVSTAAVRNQVEIEQAIAALAGDKDRGLLVLPGPVNNTNRRTIIEQAARHRLPAIYPHEYYGRDGGLLCYGINQQDQWSRAAGYVDRILKGEKPSELPVQAPTKYHLVINLKTAKALGLTMPPTLLARADEVIE